MAMNQTKSANDLRTLPAYVGIRSHVHERAALSLSEMFHDATPPELHRAMIAALDQSMDDIFTTLNPSQIERLNEVVDRVATAFRPHASSDDVARVSASDVTTFDALTERVLDTANEHLGINDSPDIATALELA